MATISKSDVKLDDTPYTWRRIREKSTIVSGNTYGPWTFKSLTQQSTNLITNLRKERQWFNESNYSALMKAKAVIPDHNYQFKSWAGKSSAVRLLGPQTTVYYGLRERTVYEYQKCPVLYSLNSNWSISISDLAVKLQKKVKGNQVNVPVFLAEAGKTATMVHDRATKIARLFMAAKKGNFSYFFDNLHITAKKPGKRKVRQWNKRFIADSTGTTASLILEYRYGWVPFMLEVQAATNTLMDVCDLPVNRRFRAKVSAKKEFVTNSNGNILLNASADGAVVADAIILRKESARLVWYYEPTPGSIPGRFGLFNPLEVAWELVPLSFVVDWFLPIGDYLSQFDMPFRFSHLGGTFGQMRSNVTTCVNFRSYSTANGQAIEGPTSVQGTHVEVLRSALSGIPMANLSSISFQPDVGSVRAISGIALLRQIIPNLLKR